jgi:hypothetical protein
MTKILEIIGLLTGLLPFVIVLIQQFETPGFGTEKKQVILDAIGSIHDQLGITVISKEKLLSIVGSFIDIAVAFFNLVGIFKHDENPT